MKNEIELRRIHARMVTLVADSAVVIQQPAPKEAHWLRDMLGWILEDGSPTTLQADRVIAKMESIADAIETIKRSKRN